jgi:hypothetical protein
MTTPAKKPKTPKAPKVLWATAAEIEIHPLLASLPVTAGVVERLKHDACIAKGGQLKDKKELHQDAAESWTAFVADLKKRGVVETMTAVKLEKPKGRVKYALVDGRDRFTGGKEAGVAKFPLKLTAEDPATFILGAQKRKHWSKQQLAFFALHVCPHLVEGAQGQRTDLQLPESFGKFASREDLAADIGCSVDTLAIAARVHALFQKDPAPRKKYLPLIFAGVSLKGVLNGDGAEKSEHGKGNQRLLPHLRLREGFAKQSRSIGDEWAAVVKQGAEAQAEVKTALSDFLTALPDALKEHAQTFFEEEAA